MGEDDGSGELGVFYLKAEDGIREWTWCGGIGDGYKGQGTWRQLGILLGNQSVVNLQFGGNLHL